VLASLDTCVVDSLTCDLFLRADLPRPFGREFQHEAKFIITPTIAFEMLEGKDLEHRIARVLGIGF